MGESPVYGIDLGTTNSCIGIWRNDDVEILPNKCKERTTPSCVAFVDNGVLVGSSAIAQQCNNPSNTIFDAKRFVGEKFDRVSRTLKYLPFKVAKDDDGRPTYDILVNGIMQKIYPEQIAAIVLQKLKEEAECYLSKEVKISKLL